MDLKLSIKLPTWLLPKRLVEDLERRSALTGKASRSFGFGSSSKGGSITLTGEDEKAGETRAKRQS